MPLKRLAMTVVVLEQMLSLFGILTSMREADDRVVAFVF